MVGKRLLDGLGLTGASLHETPAVEDVFDPSLQLFPPVAEQFAALCWRREKSKVEVLMVTTRGTGRWIIPKGWLVPGKTAAESALIEAWEEAGVSGEAAKAPIGSFAYTKIFGANKLRPIRAEVYAVEVDTLAKRWPEEGQRKRKWMSPKKAAQKVAEPELSELLRAFNPRRGNA